MPGNRDTMQSGIYTGRSILDLSVEDALQQKRKDNLEELRKKELEGKLKLLDDAVLKEQQIEIRMADYKYNLFLKNLYSEEQARLKSEKAIANLRKADDAKSATQRLKEDRQSLRNRLDAEKELRKEVLITTLSSGSAGLKDKLGAIGTYIKDSFTALKGTTKEEKTQLALEFIGKQIKQTGANIGKQISATLNAVNQTITKYGEYQAKINTRLIGTTNTFQKMTDKLSSTIGSSPYFKTEAMYDNLSKLVDSGVAFDLEQRAFLMSISDKVATTFNAMDETLLKIVRIQQADSTAARLGMEELLTRNLSSLYQDSSYLTDMYHRVESLLFEATSNLDVEKALSFEYQVQKWLGSLYSVGMSSDAISSLATAMNALATGDISGLEKSGVQNLVVMAAASSNIDYAKLLTQGITADQTNTLLGAISSYLRGLGETSNNVLKSQYAEIFGVGLSDLNAAKNIIDSDIELLHKSSLSLSGAIGELSNALTTLDERVSFAEKASNLLENFKYSLGVNIASSPVSAGVWGIADFIQSVTGGINIPFITALGTGVNLETTVENIAKLGLVGMSTFGGLSQIMTGLGSISDYSTIADNLGVLKSLNVNERGQGLISGKSGKSTSLSIVSGDVGAIQSAFLDTASEEAERKKQEQLKDEKTLTDIYELVDENIIQPNYLSKQDDSLSSILDKLDTIIFNSKRIDGGISTLANSLSLTGTSLGGLGSSLSPSVISDMSSMITQNSSVVVSETNSTDYTSLLGSIDSNISLLYSLLSSVIDSRGVRINTPSSSSSF